MFNYTGSMDFAHFYNLPVGFCFCSYDHDCSGWI